MKHVSIRDTLISRAQPQGCMGVPDPAGVLPPGVAESVPAFFFFFFFRGIRAGGLVDALRSDRYDPQVKHRLSGKFGQQNTDRN